MAKFARVETNKKDIAVCGWGPLNYILLEHPELQETKDRVKSINEIHEKQVRDGVDITNLLIIKTDHGSMGLCMDMFMGHKVTKRVLGKMNAAEKKEKRRQTGQMKNDRGDRLSAGLVAIIDGYVIGPQCLAWARRMRLEKERKEEAKQRAGRLEIICLQDKVDMVLAKG
jgi:hypothetical protein